MMKRILTVFTPHVCHQENKARDGLQIYAVKYASLRAPKSLASIEAKISSVVRESLSALMF